MHVMVVGLNYRTAPVEIREKFTFSEEKIGQALLRLKQTKSILEAVIVGTCNRTEVYAIVDQLHTGEHFIKKFYSEWFSVSKEKIIPFLYVKKDFEATEHLFKVITGLDSMILGETQVLGQVRQAFFLAQHHEATGTIFNTLFKQAITFAKKVHSKTRIGEKAVSVSYAAVELAKKIFSRLDDKNVLIIGAGEMGELTAIHLYSNGVKHVMVVNRTYEKAEKMAKAFKGEAYTMEQLKLALTKADIVISSTGSNSLIINNSLIEEVIKERSDKPLFLIDIAVPRDIDPSIGNFDNVHLYNIDDLQDIVDSNMKERQIIANQVNNWIASEVEEFYRWVNTLGVIPLIAALREKSLIIQEETMNSIEKKLPHLSERELKVIRKHTKSIVNQLLKNPIIKVKEMAVQPDAENMMRFFKEIFGLEDEELKTNSVYKTYNIFRK
ncbi:glutamyl-tRNA reductase [Vulcanibacillus modesticaldus]|uniref:Glutamyl-tRNA reductase n=1 Tax=Vulcanibacillus modesticaldus TaxID=337097 RepID=A0A1D2YSU3_9BACI|nr:glutamyl-tRNA reductase [Vulcanibacillus modesticaldus]OEF98075.1 glutamyl-tRNA reductase [Vulcanibacillus modesticaldus]